MWPSSAPSVSILEATTTLSRVWANGGSGRGTGREGAHRRRAASRNVILVMAKAPFRLSARGAVVPGRARYVQ